MAVCKVNSPKKPITGFIVNSPKGSYCMVEQEGNTLWFGSRTTLFKTREAAKAAINRTKTFARVNNYNWTWLEESWVHKVEQE